jgi:diguanylate cyclase (GGDEF)-like protein
MSEQPSALARSRANRAATRHAAIFFAAAGVVTLAGLALPHPRTVDAGLLAVVAVLCLVTAAVTWTGGERLPGWWLPAVVVCGIAFVSLGLYGNGERRGGVADGSEMYYVWTVLFAAHHLGRRMTVATVALVWVAYGVCLSFLDTGSVGTSRWLTTAGLVAGAAIVVRSLTERNHRLLADLERAARTDGLTGAANRRAFDELAAADVSVARRTGRPFGLVLLDLDGFKQLNDREGHAAGDHALVAVAEALRGAVRQGDTVARLGGDEFALLLRDVEGDGALVDTAQRVAGRAYVEAGGVRVSYGVAVFGVDGEDVVALLRAADKRLYESKRGGLSPVSAS